MAMRDGYGVLVGSAPQITLEEVPNLRYLQSMRPQAYGSNDHVAYDAIQSLLCETLVFFPDLTQGRP
jgi:hypothetical protein